MTASVYYSTNIVVLTIINKFKEEMSKAAASEDSAPRTMRELVQKKFLEEVIDAAGKTTFIITADHAVMMLLRTVSL